jgi:hypothetical protein
MIIALEYVVTAFDQTAVIEDLDRVLQTRAGRRVEYLSITWTSLEAIIGVGVGIVAGSVALIAFGDSIIEVASSCVLLWWLAEGSIDRNRVAHGGPIRLPPSVRCQSSSAEALPGCMARPVRTLIFKMESGCSAPVHGQL